jgi:hypothetical protein
MPGGGGGLTDGGGEATRVRRQPGRGRISGGRWRRRDLGGVGLSVLGGGCLRPSEIKVEGGAGVRGRETVRG